MTTSARPARAVLRGAILFIAAWPFLWGQPPVRTLFKDMPPSDPRREIIQAILDSPLDLLRARFPNKEWAEGEYRTAWARARRYFPASVYYVEPGTYFMTHGFGPDGRLFMEIHASAYLSLGVENRRIFTDGSIVAEYVRMVDTARGAEAAAFREKMGRLEFYFRDETSKKRLRKILGEALYSRLLRGLREENAHMLAGGLLHEGIHAGMAGEELVARIQADFKEGGLNVQWDELRAFMAEAVFHGSFGRRAVSDIAAGGDEVGARLAMLETLRKTPRLVGSPDREKFDKATAGLGAVTALTRLRMRELWQSAQRMQGLVITFQKDYLKPDPPPDVDGLITKLAGEIAGFVGDTGEGIQRTELALRRLEEVLGQWVEWAAGLRPFPPPVTDSKDVMARLGQTHWPAPPSADADRLKKMAERELARVRGSLTSGKNRLGIS